jgi:hypothetical protein
MSDERRPPLHPLAALSIIALDGTFGAFELVDPLALVFTCVGVGVLGFAATTLVQRNLAHEGWGSAITKGLVMGILAGVPYPILGTVIGAPLLIWGGVDRLLKRPDLDDSRLLDDPNDR